ncbi:MAG: hypoxanthine phosphoribosyltransferase [Dehalococcoidales bacterium]|jgi:hypoxanthine phosphoribosyltransferase|nr:hypoxanthine phosphoribosyltransferase [Dehalococcoidales bacterium]MDD3994534.1 hypoxanthine phosphoribosyltransferase [Dehalococcoidales bacterium]NLT28633.1 hypoxanthine phosphoribosyltransferase [Dehalococcoidales bacterium]
MTDSDKLTVLYSRDEIASKIKLLARKISRDYKDKNPLLISILKGSFMFTADLVRELDFPLEVEFVRLSSYGKGTKSCGEIEVIQGVIFEVENRDVLIVEDIVDSGLTVEFLKDKLKEKKAASVKVCALSSKPSQHTLPVDIDYLGFNIPDKFVVGYGLDYNQQFRNLPDICIMEENK